MPGPASPSLVDAEVAERAERIRTRMKRSAEDIIEIGRELSAIKRLLGHGTFGTWLDGEFGWSRDTAQRFIKVADVFGEKPQIAAFAPSALYALASDSVPAEVRERFVEQAERGEPVRFADVRAALRPDPGPPPPPPTVLPVEEIEGPLLYPRTPPAGRLSVVDDETGEIVGSARLLPPTPVPPVDLGSATVRATGESLLTPAEQDEARRRRLRLRYGELVASFRGGLLALDAGLVAEVLSDDDERALEWLARDAAKWFAAVKAARPRGLRVVGG